MSENDFFQKCKPLDENQYAHVDNDRLVLYAVQLLEENHIEPTFEKVVVVAFRLFPKTFSLMGFPEHPDARTVYYSVSLHCPHRTKQWLSGNMRSGYRLTSKGKEILDQTRVAMFGGARPLKRAASRPERKEIHFLNLLESSSAFQKYVSGRAEDITEMEIRIMLRTRKDTPLDVLRQNFKSYLQYARVADRPEIIGFLEYLRKSSKWSILLEVNRA